MLATFCAVQLSQAICPVSNFPLRSRFVTVSSFLKGTVGSSASCLHFCAYCRLLLLLYYLYCSVLFMLHFFVRFRLLLALQFLPLLTSAPCFFNFCLYYRLLFVFHFFRILSSAPCAAPLTFCCPLLHTILR